jgi:hypothetical protein
VTACYRQTNRRGRVHADRVCTNILSPSRGRCFRSLPQ